jgi:hypothetical protein
MMHVWEEYFITVRGIFFFVTYLAMKLTIKSLSRFSTSPVPYRNENVFKFQNFVNVDWLVILIREHTRKYVDL